MRKSDISWDRVLPTWSNYELDDLEREIRDERARRAISKGKQNHVWGVDQIGR